MMDNKIIFQQPYSHHLVVTRDAVERGRINMRQ